VLLDFKVFDEMLKVRMENEKLPRFKRGEGERGTALTKSNTQYEVSATPTLLLSYDVLIKKK
jgi:hypothetical protein